MKKPESISIFFTFLSNSLKDSGLWFIVFVENVKYRKLKIRDGKSDRHGQFLVIFGRFYSLGREVDTLEEMKQFFLYIFLL